jgi:4-methylaminobutanoate oxidase (formaldehyde-forming)
VTYTQLLNTRGGIEADLTVSRLGEDRFYIVTGTGFRTHDLSWIGDHVGEALDVTLKDVSEDFGTLTLMGPHARDVLSAVTDADVSNTAFPFGHAREITIAGHTVKALRVTYVGELGWELHVPIAATCEIFDALMAAGKAHGIRPVGYRALESLRLEKGYRAWGSDITPNDTPQEGGLGWAVKLRKNTDFLGRRALEKAGGEALKKRFAGFTVDDPEIVLVGRETILRNGEAVGYLTSGGYGYTIGKNVGYGYVRNADGVSDDYLASGDYELVVAMDRTPAKIHLEPMYDPAGAKIKA